MPIEGFSKLKFIVACNFHKKVGGEWVEEAQFHPVEYIGKTEHVNRLRQWLGKGTYVIVEGVVASEQWEDRTTGKRMYRTYVKALNVMKTPPTNIDRKSDEEGYTPVTRQPEGGYQPPPPKPSEPSFAPIGDDDEIPF